MRAVKCVEVQEVGKESGTVTIDGAAVPMKAELEFEDGTGDSFREGFDSDTVFNLRCNSENNCWELKYANIKELSQIKDIELFSRNPYS